MREPREILTDIASAGLTAEQMALVMELSVTLAANSRAATEAPRSKAALRQERYRERHKASQNVTGDGDVMSRDEKASLVTVGDDAAPLPPPPPSFPQTPNQPPPPPTPAGLNAPACEGGEQTGLDLGEEEQAEKPKKAAKSKADDQFVRPEFVTEEEWRDFEEMRRRISKPMTDRARRGIVTRLLELKEDGHPPGAVLEQSIVNCWASVFAIKDHRNGSGTNTGRATNFSRPGSRADEMDAAHSDLLSGRG